MEPRQFLTDKEIDMLYQIRDSVYKYVPLLQKWVDSGLPYNEHLAKAREQKEWIDNVFVQFDLEKLP